MGAAAAVGSSLVSGVSNVIASKDTNKTNRSIANQQMAFEKEQSDTVYQRGAADLKAAGLNPMLAIAHPDPVAQYTPPVYKSPLTDVMSNAITNFSALQSARQTEANIDKTKADSNLSNALTLKAAADTTSAAASAKLQGAQIDKLKSGSFLSDLVGTEAATKTSQFLNHAADSVGDKVGNIVAQTSSNSAKALDSLRWMVHPVDTINKAIDQFTGKKGGRYYDDPPSGSTTEDQARDFLINGGM